MGVGAVPFDSPVSAEYGKVPWPGVSAKISGQQWSKRLQPNSSNRPQWCARGRSRACVAWSAGNTEEEDSRAAGACCRTSCSHRRCQVVWRGQVARGLRPRRKGELAAVVEAEVVGRGRRCGHGRAGADEVAICEDEHNCRRGHGGLDAEGVAVDGAVGAAGAGQGPWMSVMVTVRVQLRGQPRQRLRGPVGRGRPRARARCKDGLRSGPCTRGDPFPGRVGGLAEPNGVLVGVAWSVTSACPPSSRTTWSRCGRRRECLGYRRLPHEADIAVCPSHRSLALGAVWPVVAWMNQFFNNRVPFLRETCSQPLFVAYAVLRHPSTPWPETWRDPQGPHERLSDTARPMVWCNLGTVILN